VEPDRNGSALRLQAKEAEHAMLSRFAVLLNEKKKRISQLDAAATRHAAITGALQSVSRQPLRRSVRPQRQTVQRADSDNTCDMQRCSLQAQSVQRPLPTRP
jgi:hypothetical protein